MKICVVGAGAIGGLIRVRLASAGEEVTLIDRGVHLEAIKENGLQVICQDCTRLVAKDVRVTDSFVEAGKHNLVIMALKAHIIEAVAPQMSALFHDETHVVPMLNAQPWWYFQRHGGEHEGRCLETCDPHGTIAANIDIMK